MSVRQNAKAKAGRELFLWCSDELFPIFITESFRP